MLKYSELHVLLRDINSTVDVFFVSYSNIYHQESLRFSLQLKLVLSDKYKSHASWKILLVHTEVQLCMLQMQLQTELMTKLCQKNGWREASEGILSSETSVPVIKIFLMLQRHDTCGLCQKLKIYLRFRV